MKEEEPATRGYSPDGSGNLSTSEIAASPSSVAPATRGYSPDGSGNLSTPEVVASPSSAAPAARQPSTPLLKLVMHEIDEMKGIKPVSIDVQDITDITDYMVVVSSTSSRHSKAIYSHLLEQAKRNQVEIVGSEGDNSSEWLLLDLNNVIVHIMSCEARELYQLESLWSFSLD